jgi:microcin C transport system substrate-binding protein
MPILPASALKNVDGAAYLREYNFKYTPNTGPYIVNSSDIDKGKGLTLRRRKDYWAAKSRWATGLNNFDEVKIAVVRDPNLIFEMVKKGDLDFYLVNRSKVWVTQLDFDKIQNGLIQKRKIFNERPEGFGGLVFNTRRPPFDDLRLRKALTLLLNRDLLMEKLFFREYLPMNSFYAGTVYANPDNPTNPYDPTQALKLLTEAGWKDRDSQGRLMKDGKPLRIELLYPSIQSQPYLTIYQEDLRKVGITLDLRLVTFETQFKLTGDRQFEMAEVAYGVPIFPDPEQTWHSRLADVPHTDNMTGFKDPRIDAVLDKYLRSFDQKERVGLIRELDSLLTSQYHYILKWRAPSQRIIYWNKFGHPRGYFTRIGEYMSGLSLGEGPEQTWWIDPAKAQALEKAIANPSIKLEVGPTEDHYWEEYSRAEAQRGAAANKK